MSQTNLDLVTKNGDLHFEGSITGYKVTSVAIQGNETAALNRLTITVKVKFTNTKDSSLDFETNFFGTPIMRVRRIWAVLKMV